MMLTGKALGRGKKPTEHIYRSAGLPCSPHPAACNKYVRCFPQASVLGQSCRAWEAVPGPAVSLISRLGRGAADLCELPCSFLDSLSQVCPADPSSGLLFCLIHSCPGLFPTLGFLIITNTLQSFCISQK